MWRWLNHRWIRHWTKQWTECLNQIFLKRSKDGWPAKKIILIPEMLIVWVKLVCIRQVWDGPFLYFLQSWNNPCKVTRCSMFHSIRYPWINRRVRYHFKCVFILTFVSFQFIQGLQFIILLLEKNLLLRFGTFHSALLCHFSWCAIQVRKMVTMNVKVDFSSNLSWLHGKYEGLSSAYRMLLVIYNRAIFTSQWIFIYSWAYSKYLWRRPFWRHGRTDRIETSSMQSTK